MKNTQQAITKSLEGIDDISLVGMRKSYIIELHHSILRAMIQDLEGEKLEDHHNIKSSQCPRCGWNKAIDTTISHIQSILDNKKDI